MNQRFLKHGEIKKSAWGVGLLALSGLLCFLLLYEGLYPWAGRRIKLNNRQVSDIARKAVAEFGYEVDEYREEIVFQGNQIQISYLQQRFGTAQANQLMREAIPAYYWEVVWSLPGFVERTLGRGTRRESENRSRIFVNRIAVRISETGQILSMDTELERESSGLDVLAEQVRPIAEKLMQEKLKDRREHFISLGSQSRQFDNRVEHQFKWQDEELIAGETLQFTVSLVGDQVSSYGFAYHVPESYVKENMVETLAIFPSILMFIFLVILMFVMLIKKLRSDEIAIAPGLPFGIATAFALILIFLLSGQQRSMVDLILLLAIAVPFVAFVLTLAVSTSDVIAREVWPNKLLTLDALRCKRVYHRYFGESLLRGIALALFTIGIITILLKIGSLLFPLYFLNQGTPIAEATGLVPALYTLAEVTFNTFFLQFTIVLFLISYFAQKFTHQKWIAATVAIIWGIGMSGLGYFTVSPFFMAILIKITIATLFILAFLRYDFLTALSGYFLFTLFYKGFPMIISENNFIMMNGIAIILVFVGIGVFGFLALRKTMTESEITRFEPSYVHRINERIRIQRELEIARDVQLSFLPRMMPEIDGLDIATICIPATEVGGDYYDFVDLGDNKLGIAIGDVSGKGISAAFYMTLTKGFFRSQASLLDSPKEVLIRINQLFYENVERGHFISMIYGVFDMEKFTFTFARAGHNPVIVRRGPNSKSEVLCPSGMALGLEKGDLFREVIEEQHIKLNKDDFFILYTDGFTEAMDSQQYEFGEERLYKLVENEKGTLAQELSDIIISKIQSFVGRTPQHDDMTMVVIHVLSDNSFSKHINL